MTSDHVVRYRIWYRGRSNPLELSIAAEVVAHGREYAAVRTQAEKLGNWIRAVTRVERLESGAWRERCWPLPGPMQASAQPEPIALPLRTWP